MQDAVSVWRARGVHLRGHLESPRDVYAITVVEPPGATPAEVMSHYRHQLEAAGFALSMAQSALALAHGGFTVEREVEAISVHALAPAGGEAPCRSRLELRSRALVGRWFNSPLATVGQVALATDHALSLQRTTLADVRGALLTHGASELLDETECLEVDRARTRALLAKTVRPEELDAIVASQQLPPRVELQSADGARLVVTQLGQGEVLVSDAP